MKASITAASLISLLLISGDNVITYDTPRGVKVPVYHVSTITQDNPGDVSLFASKVAPILNKYSKDSGFEYCGGICLDDNGRHGLIVTTANSQITCPLTNACPKGYKLTGADIHSHPHNLSINLNSIDRLYITRGKSSGSTWSLSPETPSIADFSVNDGYVVTPTKLLRHNGRRVFYSETLNFEEHVGDSGLESK